MGNQHANEGRLAQHHYDAPPRAALDEARVGKQNGVDAAWGASAPALVGKTTLTGTLYRHVADSAGTIDHDDPRIDAALARAGGGSALSPEVRAPLEAHLGYSLDRVRVHTDSTAAAAARALRAEAFTIGEDIYFADGKFAPSSQAGKQLLAHEVMHVVQAWEGRTRRGGGLQVSDPGESLEREAEAVATAMQSRTVNALAGSTAWAGAPARAPGGMSAGGSSLVLRKPSGAKLKGKGKGKGKATTTAAQEAAPASPESASANEVDPLIAGVIQVVDRASARIEAAAANPVTPAPAPAAMPTSVPTMTVEIDFANIKVRAVKKPEAGQAPQAPQTDAPKASASTSHGGTRTVEGDTTLDVALTRLQIPTTYRLGGAHWSAGEKTVKAEIEAAKEVLAAAKKVVAETKAKIDPPKAKAKGKAKQPVVSAEEKAQALKDLPALEEKVATLEEELKAKEATFKADSTAHTLKQLEAQVSGDKDANEFWCSGLSLWTLAASGYDLEMKLRGVEDGQPFKFKPRKGGKPQFITLKQIVDGEGPAVEAVAIIQRDKLTKGAAQIIELAADADFGGHRLGYGADGSATSDGVKGAAGAFALFNLGAEIAQGAQKPGDFAQRRETQALDLKDQIKETKAKLAKKTIEEDEKKELEAHLAMLESEQGKQVHVGKGHAWQVTEVRAEGQAMFGAPGSPRLLVGKSPAAAAWLESAIFVIDRTTRPELVGEHTVDAERLIEANIASSTKTENGTVRETDELRAPKKNAKPAKERTVFYGRLNESPWASWKPATEASAREYVAANEAAPAAATAAEPAAASE